MTRVASAPLAVCAAWVCACSTPTPQIVLGLAGPPTQACPSAVLGGPPTCEMIPLPCDAVMSIRIVDPGADPADVKSRYVDQCVPVLPGPGVTICSLNSVSLDPKLIPVRDLAVQIAVFPGSAVRVNPANGKLVCPDVAYSAASGFPIEQEFAPALGRQVYYHPGDTTVEVKLGCTDLSSAHAGESCHNPGAGAATATILDFDSQVPVPVGQGEIADDLFVWAGEPRIFQGSYVLRPADLSPMKLDGNGTAHWAAEVAQTFDHYACVEVLENSAQSAALLHCTAAAEASGELTGYWINRRTLDPILKEAALVLGGTGLPDGGLTIGLVVDATSGSGVENVAVRTSGPGHITYLSPVGAVGRDATFKNGVFVSDDTPFGTSFFAAVARAAIGGLVVGKATVVVLTMGGPTH
jgi:hypothetical protein